MSAPAFDDVLFGPLFDALGVAAVITYEGAEYEVTAIDKTQGVETAEFSMNAPLIVPAAQARASELAGHGLSADDLDGAATISLNGATWEITAHRRMQSPFGASDGAVMFYLEQ